MGSEMCIRDRSMIYNVFLSKDTISANAEESVQLTACTTHVVCVSIPELSDDTYRKDSSSWMISPEQIQTIGRPPDIGHGPPNEVDTGWNSIYCAHVKSVKDLLLFLAVTEEFPYCYVLSLDTTQGLLILFSKINKQCEFCHTWANVPYQQCNYCGKRPSWHHGNCCPNKDTEGPPPRPYAELRD